MGLRQAIERKRSELINREGVVFHHDNARLHTSLATRQKLKELGWKILTHPFYSSDLASNCHSSLKTEQNFLNGVKLTSKEVKIICRSFSPRNHKSSTVTGLWFYLKNGRRWSNKTAHIWFNKFHLKYEKKFVCIKIRRNFFPNLIYIYISLLYILIILL